MPPRATPAMICFRKTRKKISMGTMTIVAPGHLQIYLGAHRIPEVEQTDGHNPVGIALGDHKGARQRNSIG